VGTEFSLVEMADLARETRDRVCLAGRPVGISLIDDPAQIPARAKRPSARGLVWPVCLAANQVRTLGWTVALTMEDQFCTFAAAGLGHIELPPYLRHGAMGRHHTKTEELGRQIQEKAEASFFSPGSSQGVMLTPATDPLFLPEGLFIYGNPTQIGKIAKAITWHTGETVDVSAGGFGGCIAAMAAVRARRPLIILPCSGEKIFGHTEENDIFLACPAADLPRIVEGLRRTDFIQPYPTAKYLMFEPGIPRGYPIDYQSYRKHLSGES
jgi:uncharacterized protein (DUF169 family)